MSIDNEKFAPASCIPVRSEDIKWTEEDGGGNPYYVGVRPKELMEYQWPDVAVHTAALTCDKLSTLPYDKVIFGYDIQNHIRLAGTSETNYGGAKVLYGYLRATVRNFYMNLTPDIPIIGHDCVRKSGSVPLELSTELCDPIKIVEVGLLQADQIHINSTLAKANVLGNISVYIENSALYESLIEAGTIVHASGGAQIQANIEAPYIFLDKFSMIEGKDNALVAEKWLCIANVNGFNYDYEEEELVESSSAYGVTNITDMQSTCITIKESSLSGCSMATPQLSLKNGRLHSCAIALEDFNELAQSGRLPSKRRETFVTEVFLGDTTDGFDVDQQYGTETIIKAIDTDVLREDLYVTESQAPLLYRKECASPVYSFDNDGRKWSENCISRKSNKPGAGLISRRAMINIDPYARDRDNEEFQFQDESFKAHSIINNNFSKCSIDSTSGEIYFSRNNFYQNSSVTVNGFLGHGNDTFNASSLECAYVSAYFRYFGGFGGDNSASVSLFNESVADIGYIYSHVDINNTATLRLVEQDSLGFYRGGFGSISSASGGNVEFLAPTMTLGGYGSVHGGNYTIQNLRPIVVRAGDPAFTNTSNVQIGSISGQSIDFAGRTSVGGDISIGSLFNGGTLSASSINFTSVIRNEGGNISHGGTTTATITANSIVGPLATEYTQQYAPPVLENRGKGIINAATINCRIISELDSLIDAGTIDAFPPSDLRGDITASNLNLLASSRILPGDDFQTRKASNIGSLHSMLPNFMDPSKVDIGTLSAEYATIGNLGHPHRPTDFAEGSSIGTANLTGCICHTDWMALGTQVNFFGNSTNHRNVANATFLDSNQVGGLISGCSFDATIVGEGPHYFYGINTAYSVTPLEFGGDISIKNCGGTVQLSNKHFGSHSINIEASRLSSTDISRALIELDLDGDGEIDAKNTLSVSASSGTFGECQIGADTIVLNNFGGGKQGADNSVGAGLFQMRGGSFSDTIINATRVDIEKAGFSNCDIAVGSMKNCSFQGSISRGGKGTLNGINFDGGIGEFARGYPNVGVVKTCFYQHDSHPFIPCSGELWDPRNPIVEPLNAKLYGDIESKSFLFNIVDASIESYGSYNSLGIVDTNVSVSSETTFKDCHIVNMEVNSIANEDEEVPPIIFSNCMLDGFTAKSLEGITLSNSTILGSRVPQNALFSSQLNGVVPNLNLTQNSENRGTIFVGENNIDEGPLINFRAGTKNFGSVSLTTTDYSNNLFEAELVGYVHMDGATNEDDGSITCKNTNLKNTTNKGKIGTTVLTWMGGNTNTNTIDCQVLFGIGPEGIGPLVKEANTRVGADGLPLVRLAQDIGDIGSPETFTYDYGPFWRYTDGSLTTTAPPPTQISSVEMDADISVAPPTTCLPAVGEITDSNEYYLNGTRLCCHGWHFHDGIRQYHFQNVPDDHPIGFPDPPTGFTYTGSRLIGIRDNTRFYSGTVTMSISEAFDSSVSYESLYGTNNYKGVIGYVRECPDDFPPGDGEYPAGPTPPPQPPGPTPPPSPCIDYCEPIPPEPPHGTPKYASFNPVFGIRIYYNSERKSITNPETNQVELRPEITLIDGIPLRGANTGSSNSFNEYILDQIILPDILDEYFNNLASDMQLPRIRTGMDKSLAARAATRSFSDFN